MIERSTKTMHFYEDNVEELDQNLEKQVPFRDVSRDDRQHRIDHMYFKLKKENIEYVFSKDFSSLEITLEVNAPT